MEQIDPSQIHLWLAFLDEIADPCLLDDYRRLLSREELQKQQRFHFERDRHRFLVTRAMVRTILSSYADVAPRDWRFTVNSYGKPSIDSDLASARTIAFNVSHADGLVIMGIASERSIGVDVENVRARAPDMAIAHRYLAAEEVKALRALPREQQQMRFFEYWTLKESYIKARGAGLSVALDSFWFTLSADARMRMNVRPAAGDRINRWSFWQLRPHEGYLAAVCAEGYGEPLRLMTRRIIPVRR